MAGGGSLGGGPKPKRGKSSKRKKAKRVGFHLDMTPLVDITFLLLTFFMFTTTLTQPTIMDMKMPPEAEGVNVKESELFTILINEDGSVWYYPAKEEAQQISISKLQDEAAKRNIDMRNRLITLLKSHPKAPYGVVVNVLDELNLAEQLIIKALQGEIDPETGSAFKRKRKFTLAEWTEEDAKKIEEAGGGSGSDTAEGEQ